MEMEIFHNNCKIKLIGLRAVVSYQVSWYKFLI